MDVYVYLFYPKPSVTLVYSDVRYLPNSMCHFHVTSVVPRK